MHTRSIVCAAAAVLILLPHGVAAQTPCATLEPTAAFRRHTVRVTLKTPPSTPAPAPETVPPFRPTIESGIHRNAGGTAITRDLALRLDGGTGTFVVPEDLPLGDYAVNVAPGCSMSFAVRSPAPTMTEFAPPGDYPSGMNGVVHFTIRGGGFIVDRPVENRLYVNGEDLAVPSEAREGVLWGSAQQDSNRVTCSPGQRTGQGANAGKLAAFVENAGVIHVCNVPAELGDRVDGGLLGSMKLRPRVLRVAVGQYGVKPTDPWPFRIYPFWAGQKMVTIIAISAAVVLSGFVLLCIVRYRRTRTAATTGRVATWDVLCLDFETDTYSLSKLQFYLWTFAALFAYSYLVISRLMVQGR
ncbi:MAG: hypothetical protein AB7F99_18585, partial [Vicinamibacterales bacterium]